MLSGLLISNRRERLLFKPFASATLLIGTNELRAMLASAFSTSEELEALLTINIYIINSIIYVFLFFIHRTDTLPRSQKHWNTNSDLCVINESINFFHVTGILKKFFS